MSTDGHMSAELLDSSTEGPFPGNADGDDGWFHTRHELHPSLPEGFPVPRLGSGDRGYFRVGPDGWTGYWPAEDHAVAPELEWTEAHRILVLAAYSAEWGRFLDENQTYEIVWPPRACLKTEGYVVLGQPLGCLVHDDPDCDECDEFQAAPSEIKPAEWSWSVGIELYEWDGHSGSLEETESFGFLTTLIDPRDVDYDA